MREQFSFIFILIIIALVTCAVMAQRSSRPIGKYVSRFVTALTPPVAGNLIIVMTSDEIIANIGYYCYFVGMDLVMVTLLIFTLEYCSIKWKKGVLKSLFNLAVLADVLQYVVDLFLGQAFDVEAVSVDERPYYRLVPLLGQTMHRVLDYSILAVIIAIFAFKVLKTPRIYREKFSVVLIVLIIAALWQTAYIFSRTPVDRSMIGFGCFGLLIYYFAILYRPMKLLDRMLANIVSDMPEALFFFDENERCIWANNPGADLVGIEDGEFDRAPEKLGEMFGDEYRRTKTWSSDIVLGSGESAKYYALSNRLVTMDDNKIAGSLLSVRDNTGEQRKLRREMYNATHDRLTGLYTREYLYQRIHDTLAAHPDTEYYIVFVDVKNFKIVNDIFSSDFGDYAICCIADLIRANMTRHCVYGRLAGDTFGFCIPVREFNAVKTEDQLTRFVVSEGNIEYHILIHIGLYRTSGTELDVSVMFDRAHLALSTIRDEYQTHIAYYDDEIRKKVLWDQHISSQLHEAITAMHLRPYLQAIVDATGRTVGAEALARWIHPTDGFLSPAAFIPVFEKNGMIVEVDKHMWRCACEILSRWDGDRSDMFISVNISPKDFYFMDVKAEIMRLTKEYGIDPSRLRIEITETVMMNDSEDRIKILNDFRRDGFIVEMDDFGSGYSSLNMLKDMPVDVLKLDMKFLNKTSDGDKARTILQNIIKLTSDLGISSLTEGVETVGQYEMLVDMGCELFQGYYFAKPMPVEDFEKNCMASK